MAKLNWQKANKQRQAYYQGTEDALTSGQRKLQRIKYMAQTKARLKKQHKRLAGQFVTPLWKNLDKTKTLG